MIRSILDRLLLLLLSAVIAMVALVPLENMGVFGSRFEGQSGYAALYFGFPILTVVFAVLAVSLAPRPLPAPMRFIGWAVLALVIIVLFLF